MSEKADKIVAEQVDKDRFNYVYYDKIKSFTSYLELGDLATASLIIYGFVLYGMTRIGKTATAHLFSGNPLKGFKKNGQEMVYATTSKNPMAVIGNTMNSETVIPNKFELKNYKVNGEKACIVDTPGYGDTDGILKILANGFFHYRLYSKIQNMKFIVCFDTISLKNTGKDVVETIVNFTKSFKDYSDMKEKIWDSSCFLFTKVDLNEDSVENIKIKLQNLVNSLKTQKKPQEQALIKEFIQYIINKDKIFIIQKYRDGQSSNDAHLLSNIDEKVKSWWSRKLNPQNPKEVDMSDVTFPLGKDVVVQTTDNDLSQDQLAELVKMYSSRIEQFIGGENSTMKQIFDNLVKDALGSPYSRNFLTPMEKYVTKYYPKPKNGQKYGGYQEDRQKEEISLFQTNSDLSNSRVKDPLSADRKIKPKNYPIKKLTALKNIENLMKEINKKQFVGRDISWLQQCQTILFQIIKELGKVAYNNKDRKNIVYRYGYIVRRIVEEAKVFVLLLEKFSSTKIKQSIKQKCNGKQIELFRPLKDFMGIGFSYNKKSLSYQELRLIYVKNFDPQSQENKNLEITADFIKFFSHGEADDNQTKLKIAKVILKYSTQTLNEKSRIVTYQEQIFMVQNLLKFFNCCHELHALFEDNIDKDRAKMMVRKLGKNLGRVLQDLKKYELSRSVYDSILYVDSVCRIYRNEIDDIDNSGQNSIQVRLSYSRYLMNHLRENDAIKMLQQTYQMAEQSLELEEVHMQLSQSMIKFKDKTQTDHSQYGKDIFAQVYFQKLNQQVIKELQTICSANKNQKVKQASNIIKQQGKQML